MQSRIHILPDDRILFVPKGAGLLDSLRDAAYFVDAPCGGNGTCGKCRVLVDGQWQQACAYQVEEDITVTLPNPNTLGAAQRITAPKTDLVAAIDIGTTGVVCRLLTAAGECLATQTATNPQVAWGADVVSRIQHACRGERQALTDAVRRCVSELVGSCCHACGVDPNRITLISPVGNSCMQQLFLGMDMENLAQIPFAPAITKAAWVPAGECLPICANADMLVLPDIAGFVGADTLGCIVAADLMHTEDTVLLVDI